MNNIWKDYLQTNKFIALWKTSFHLTYVVLEKITMRNIRNMIENVEKVRVIFMELSKTFGLINYS